MTKLLLISVRIYQYIISPIMPPSCRFYPTCSHYAYEAIKNRGAIRGVGLALKRLIRCHPFSEGGHDPLPTGNER